MSASKGKGTIVRCDQIPYNKGRKQEIHPLPLTHLRASQLYKRSRFCAAWSDSPVPIQKGIYIQKSLQAYGESHQCKPDFLKSYMHIKNGLNGTAQGRGRRVNVLRWDLRHLWPTSIRASSAEEEEWTYREKQLVLRTWHPQCASLFCMCFTSDQLQSGGRSNQHQWGSLGD